MKDKPTFSSHPRYGVAPAMSFLPVRRPVAGKSRVKTGGVTVHAAQMCDSAFLADRGCLGGEIPPKRTIAIWR